LNSQVAVSKEVGSTTPLLAFSISRLPYWLAQLRAAAASKDILRPTNLNT
jgi:hypothetical protein